MDYRIEKKKGKRFLYLPELQEKGPSTEPYP